MNSQKIMFNIAKVLLALLFMVFGSNKFIGFAELPLPEDAVAQQFLGAMFSSYLAPLVGGIQMIGGVLLLIPRTTFIGALVLLPVTVNIVFFHVVHDMPGNGMWIFVLGMHSIILYFFKEKAKYFLVEEYKRQVA